MGRVVVMNQLTLDGVMQSPGRPDEDTRGGFALGGWAVARSDEAIGAQASLRVVGTSTTGNGVVIVSYERAAGQGSRD